VHSPAAQTQCPSLRTVDWAVHYRSTSSRMIDHWAFASADGQGRKLVLEPQGNAVSTRETLPRIDLLHRLRGAARLAGLLGRWVCEGERPPARPRPPLVMAPWLLRNVHWRYGRPIHRVRRENGLAVDDRRSGPALPL
jgi:hypothetical protein